MFTGLVQKIGTIREIVSGAESVRLVVAAELTAQDRIVGASVAVSGVCLTVVASGSGQFQAQAAFETLQRTRLGSLRAGSRVNLEPALRLGDPLGGHLVGGHVDGLGHLLRREARGPAMNLWFSMPTGVTAFVAEKGSICIDGVSLTVNESFDDQFCVGVIPHTLDTTTLGALKVGDPVNLEVDLLARYVARLLQFQGGTLDSEGAKRDAATGVSLESLARGGFLGTGEIKGNHE